MTLGASPCGCPALGELQAQGQPLRGLLRGKHKIIGTPSLAHPNPFFQAAIVF